MKIPDRGCKWRHAPVACAEDLGRFEKVSWVDFCPGGRLLTFACLRRPYDVCARVGGRRRWKCLNRKNVYLSPYVKGPLNSKVIKSFVPELRSRKCFSCFVIPMFYVYMLWTFYVLFPHIRIWLWYRNSSSWFLNQSIYSWLKILPNLKGPVCSLKKNGFILYQGSSIWLLCLWHIDIFK